MNIKNLHYPLFVLQPAEIEVLKGSRKFLTERNTLLCFAIASYTSLHQQNDKIDIVLRIKIQKSLMNDHCQSLADLFLRNDEFAKYFSEQGDFKKRKIRRLIRIIWIHKLIQTNKNG